MNEPSSDATKEQVIQALRDVVDPELGINIVDLGLVYGVDVDADGLRVRLTMTTPTCPLGESILDDAKARLHELSSPGNVRIDLVWDPPWDPSRLSAQAKRELGWGE